MTNKNKILIVLCVIVLMLILTGSTYCYYTHENEKREQDLKIATMQLKVPIVPESYIEEHLKEMEYENSDKNIEQNKQNNCNETNTSNDVSRGSLTREIYIGTFKISAYCPNSCCNGNYAGVTASGHEMIPYKTVAVDPNVIPLGTKLKIVCNDKTFYVVANDTGGAIRGNKLDLSIDTHQNAINWGVPYGEVWIVQ